MPCLTYGNSIVCTAPDSVIRRRIMECPTCDRRRRFAVRWMGAYYGQNVTCLGCGDSWTDGEMHERPFRRGWRKESINKANRDWNRALTPAEYKAEIDAEMESMREDWAS